MRPWITPKNRTFASALLPFLFTLAAPLAQQPAEPSGWSDNPQATPPSLQIRNGVLTYRTRVQLVVQDITVTDAAGNPVTGLTQKDFHIFEDGREQTTRNFEEHAPINPALAKERADQLAHVLPPNTFTNYKAFSGGTLVVFLLDTVEEHGCGSGVDAQMNLRQEMIAYLKTVPPGTPYIILQLDTRLHMVQDMTTDLDALRTAVNGKRDSPALPPQLAAVGSELADANLRRRQIVTAAMKQLKQYLGALPGRKNLVWFSSPLYQNLALIISGVGEWKSYPTFAAYMSGITTSLEQSRIAIYHMEGSQLTGSEVWAGPGPTPTDEEKGKMRQPHPGWEEIAPALEMFDQPAACVYPQGYERIAALVGRSQHYYTLTYSPTNQNFNGQPRKFSVELADKTLHLDYRRSYLASLTDAAVQPAPGTSAQTAASETVLHQAAGPSISMQTAMGMGTIEPTQVIFEASATRAATETKDSGNTSGDGGNFLLAKYRKQGYRDYTVHFRVRANELKLLPSPDGRSYSGKLEFVAVVYDNQGQAVNGKQEKASASFTNLTDPQLQTAELTGDMTIQVPAKGSYFLRLGVHDSATDRVGALEIPIDRIPLTAK